MPGSIKTVRLNLARAPQFPDGSDRHGYTFSAPPDVDGQLDAEAWRKNPSGVFKAVRFWGRDEEGVGHLVHRPGGSWGFTYDISGGEGEESGFKSQSHRFGEYVSIRDDKGELNTFRVASVEDA